MELNKPVTEYDRFIQRSALGSGKDTSERCKGFKKNGCKTKVPQYTGRCDDCEAARQVYADGGFGLNEIVAKRQRDQRNGICMFCCLRAATVPYVNSKAQILFGSDAVTVLLCEICVEGQKTREYELQHCKAKRTPNPYRNVFDSVEDNEEVDGQMVLVPNGEIMADRDEATARYWQAIADWEDGPRGRQAQENARIYRQLAQNMRDYHEKVKRLSR